MRIILIGDGRVGHSLAEHLCQEEHDIVIIDQSEEAIQRSENTLDAMCIRANGANARALIDAGADKADIIIATTASDETNMVCCLFAKRLGTKYAIARIRDPEYNESLMLLQEELGIDMAINPERATALEISRLLRFPFASNIEPFAKGRVEMVEFRAQENDMLIGTPLKQLSRDIPRVLYAAVDRDGEVYIPSGDFVIKAGDKVHIVAEPVTITSYFRFLGRNTSKVRNVMLLGGSRISYYLAKLIVPIGIRVTMLEKDQHTAEHLSELLPDVNIILGDGTDQELLQEEGLTQMDAFVALGNRDEENLMTGLYAVREGVPKVIVKNNHGGYTDIISSMGLDSVISPKAITCSTILRYVRARANGGRGTQIVKLYRLIGGKAEAIEFIAREGDSYIGVPLRELKIRKNCLVGVIVHKGKVIVPFGNDKIEAGDNVVIIVCERGITDLNEVIHR